MTSNITNQVSYLRTSRLFPDEIGQLTVEITKAYIDIANTVNARTIGIFSINRAAITGESWFVSSNQRQQTLRQVYTFSSDGSIAHGLNLNTISGFTRLYGTFTDGTNWYPLPYVDVTSADNQINLEITPTDIVITSGGGSPPSITSGFVVIEYLSRA